MDKRVRFEPIRLGGNYVGEEACLGLIRSHVVTILVRVEDETLPCESQGWFLEIGFGPCRGEGRLFQTLDAAARWMISQLPPNWPEEVGAQSLPVEATCPT